MVFCQELTPSKPCEDIKKWFTMVKFQFKLNAAIQLVDMLLKTTNGKNP
jgi:hypothetical protein